MPKLSPFVLEAQIQPKSEPGPDPSLFVLKPRVPMYVGPLGSMGGFVLLSLLNPITQGSYSSSGFWGSQGFRALEFRVPKVPTVSSKKLEDGYSRDSLYFTLNA